MYCGGFWLQMTFQMQWPLATSNCGIQWKQIASLWVFPFGTLGQSGQDSLGHSSRTAVQHHHTTHCSLCLWTYCGNHHRSKRLPQLLLLLLLPLQLLLFIPMNSAVDNAILMIKYQVRLTRVDSTFSESDTIWLESTRVTKKAESSTESSSLTRYPTHH